MPSFPFLVNQTERMSISSHLATQGFAIALLLMPSASAQCVRLPDGSWSCPQKPSAPIATPTAMDIRIECPTARGSGTAVARLASGGTVVVTNHHVIQGQRQIVLRSGDGRSAVGEVLHVDTANDLALVATAEEWPIVSLGDDVPIGSLVQFRAFDRGTHFRKYGGRIVSEYSPPGAANGYFATGPSVAGNSGGGVYSHGKLVGVIWGNPAAQTAFVRIGPIRRLLGRIRGVPGRNPQQLQRFPSAPPAPRRSSRPALPASPHPSRLPCDCEERWAALDRRLEQWKATIERPTRPPQRPRPPIERPTPSGSSGVVKGLSWGKIVAGALGVSGPIGLGIAIAGGLVGWRRKQRKQPRRGAGGPRGAPFQGEPSRSTHRQRDG